MSRQRRRAPDYEPSGCPRRASLLHGDVRWESRVGFARQQAIERGYLNAQSPRGLWELTEAGKQRLRELEAVCAEAGGSER